MDRASLKEKQAWLLAHRDEPGALWQLVETVEPYITSAARIYVRVFGLAEDLVDDLFEEGRLAAYRAMQLFDPVFGTSVMTVVVPHVKARLRRYGREQRNLVHIPVGVLDGGTPAPDHAKAVLKRAKGRHSTVDIWESPHENGISYAELLPYEGNTAEPDLINHELFKMALGCLSKRERYVIEQRLDDRILEDIGQELGVTRERIRQIEAKAMKRMAKRVSSLSTMRMSNTRPDVGDYSRRMAAGINAATFKRRALNTPKPFTIDIKKILADRIRERDRAIRERIKTRRRIKVSARAAVEETKERAAPRKQTTVLF